jgi:aspartokinase
MVTTSEIKISALLKEQYKSEVVKLLAEEFSL